MEDLARRIKEVQVVLKISQPEMARRVGVSLRTLKSYIAGKTRPDSSVLKILCDDFNLDPGWLLLGEGKMLAQTGGKLKREKKSLLAVFEKLDGDRRRMGVDFMNLLKRLWDLDKSDRWEEAGGRGVIPRWRFQERLMLVRKQEWSCLEEFVPSERAKLESEQMPEEYNGQLMYYGGGGSTAKEIRDASKMRKRKLELKIKELKKMWDDIPDSN